jgi:hypothetical protein
LSRLVAGCELLDEDERTKGGPKVIAPKRVTIQSEEVYQRYMKYLRAVSMIVRRSE